MFRMRNIHARNGLDCNSRFSIRTLLLLSAMCFAPSAFSISTMRCGNNLIEVGDDKFRVLDICGEPASTNDRTKVVGSTLHHPRRTLDLQQYEEVQVEEWVYDFGRNRFRELLRFENGVLVEIQDLRRGR